jgi:tetratricopeptide (TPR) repeat protein
MGGMVCALVDGDFDAAAEQADNLVATSQLLRGASADADIYPNLIRVETAFANADPQEMADFFLEDARETLSTDTPPDALSGIYALTQVEGGRMDVAREMLDKFGANDFGDIVDDAGWFIAVSVWSDVAAALRDEQACRALLRILSPYHDVANMTGGWFGGSYARNLALLSDSLGEYEASEAWFAEAHDFHERLASRPWSARTKVDQALRLLERGERDRAVQLSRSALSDIGTLSLDNCRNRAQAILNSVS